MVGGRGKFTLILSSFPFTEFTLSEILQSLCSLRMTKTKGSGSGQASPPITGEGCLILILRSFLGILEMFHPQISVVAWFIRHICPINWATTFLNTLRERNFIRGYAVDYNSSVRRASTSNNNLTTFAVTGKTMGQRNTLTPGTGQQVPYRFNMVCLDVSGISQNPGYRQPY